MARRRFTVAHRRGDRMSGVNVLSTTSFRPCGSQYDKGVSGRAGGWGFDSHPSSHRTAGRAGQ